MTINEPISLIVLVFMTQYMLVSHKIIIKRVCAVAVMSFLAIFAGHFACYFALSAIF